MWQTVCDHYVVFSRVALASAGYLLVQSSILLLIGLIAGRLLHGAGAALQSAVYRLTLAAVMCCPALSLMFYTAGLKGIAVNLPMPPSAVEQQPISELAPASYAPPKYATPVALDAPEKSEMADEVIEVPVATPIAANKSPTNDISPSPRSNPINWTIVAACSLTAVWLFVSSALLIRLLCAWRLTRSLRRSACPVPARILDDCRTLADQMKVHCPQVLQSPFTASPLLIGIWRPMILLPEGDSSEARGREILVHELAHLARRDIFWNLLGRMGTAILFFQPLLWDLMRKIMISSEEVCDDFVVHLGLDRSGYAQQLVEIAENHQPLPVMSAGVISLRSFVGRRVARILDSSRQISTGLQKRTAIVVVLISVTATCLAGLITLGANRAAADTEKAAPDGEDHGQGIAHATVDEEKKEGVRSPEKFILTATQDEINAVLVDEVREAISPETKVRSISFRVHVKKGERFYVTTRETSKRRDRAGGNILFESEQDGPIPVKLTFKPQNSGQKAGDVLLGKAELIGLDVDLKGCYPPGVSQLVSTPLGDLPPDERKIVLVKSGTDWGARGAYGRRVLLIYPKSKSAEKFEEIEPRAEIVVAKQSAEDRHPAQPDLAQRLSGIWMRQRTEIGTAQIEYLHVNLDRSHLIPLTAKQVEKILTESQLDERPENLESIFPKILVKYSPSQRPKGVRKFISVGSKTREDFTVAGRLEDVRYVDGEIDLSYSAANSQVDVISAENLRMGRATLHDFRIAPDSMSIVPDQIRVDAAGRAVISIANKVYSKELTADAATGFIYRQTMRVNGKISDDEFQYFPTKYSPNIVYPKMRIRLRYASKELQSLEIHRIDSAKFNEAFSPDAFTISLPPPLKVYDYRKDGFHPEYHSIKSKVPNLVAFIYGGFKELSSNGPKPLSEATEPPTSTSESPKEPEKAAEKAEPREKPNAETRVIDSQGNGIANATIAPQVQEGIVSWKVTTDRDGRCTLPPLESGVQDEMITISAPGFLSKELIRIRNRPASGKISLQKATSIAGRVLGTDGKPLAHAPLALSLQGSFVGGFFCYRHAISDADGNFSIDNIPPGIITLYYPGTTPTKYELELGRDKGLLRSGETWPAPPIKEVYGSVLAELKDGDKLTGLTMDLSQSTCRVGGRVLAPDGKPLAGATVSARRYYRNLSFSNLIHPLNAGDISAISDVDGRFQLEHLPPGKWALSVWTPHYQRPGKIEYIDFGASGEEIARDLQVFERYEAENVFPERIAIEKAESLRDLPKLKKFFFETPTMAQYRGMPREHSYSFAGLTVNSTAGARINIGPLNLPGDASPEQIAKAAHVGELYYIEPDKLVTVNGTILVPCILPEKHSPQETPVSRLSRLTRAELVEQVQAALRETPAQDGQRVSFQKGDWFLAVRNDGRAFLVNIESEQSLSKEFVRLGTYYVGILDFHAQPQERPADKLEERSSSRRAEASTAAATEKLPVPAKTVHGRVVDENGKPISEADVWIMPAWDPVQKRKAAHSVSDAEGQFTLPVPSLSDHDMKTPCPYPIGMIWAYARGHQLSLGYGGDQIFGRNKADVVLRLAAAAETSFSVLGPDGKPLEGAMIEPGHVNNSEPPDEVRGRVAVRTNTEGRAIFTAASREAMSSIRIVAADYGIQTQSLRGIGSAPADQPIRLRQAGKVSGKVTVDAPKMLRPVRIMLYSSSTGAYPNRGILPSMTRGYAEVVSDDKGAFSVPAIAAGSLSIDARVSDDSSVQPRIPDYTHQKIEVHPGEATELQIPLESTVMVKGSVYAKDTGEPIAETFVQLRYEMNGHEAAIARTDRQGDFSASVLPGRVLVEMLNPQGKYIQFGNSPIVEVPAKVKDFSIPAVELVPAKSIAGRLVDRQDQPVVNARIWVAFDDRSYGFTETNAKGEFTLSGVPAPIDAAKAKYQTLPPRSEDKIQGNWLIQSPPADAEIVQTEPLVLRLIRQ